MKFRAAVLAASAAIVPGAAHAFVCTATNPADPKLTQVWQQTCIPYAISCNSALFESAENRALVKSSFDVWEQAGCSDVRFIEAGFVRQGAELDSTKPSEQRNVIGSIDTQAELDDVMMAGSFPDRRLVAVTLTRFSPQTGEIIDADIQLNSVDFKFEDVTDQPGCVASGQRRHDIRNTLVHEIGHLIGFDHTPVRDATMFAMADNCELKKRDLDADDLEAICTVYPTGGPIKTCRPAPDGNYTPDGASDPRPFRNQCARFEGIAPADRTACDFTEAEAGGCSCSASKDGDVAGMIASLLAMAGLAALRANGR